MSKHEPHTEPPSPMAFIGSVLYGAMMGFLPALVILMVPDNGLLGALGITALLVAAAAIYHFTGWLLVMAPIKAVRWLWRKLTGRPVPAQPEDSETTITPRHWVEIAGFWCGFALINLLALHDSLQKSRGLA